MLKSWKGLIATPVRSCLRRAGYDLRRLPIGGEQSPGTSELDELIGVVRSNTMLSRPRLEAIYDQVLFCEREDLEGAFVECGVWKGGAVGLMALANLKHSHSRRHLHLFDSFCGIPEPDDTIDGTWAVEQAKAHGTGVEGRLIANPQLYEKLGYGVGTQEDNRRLLEGTIGYDPDFIHYHEGFFQDTVPLAATEIGAIALLRLDGDWYASTKVCLEHFYDRVVPGGVITIDDYGTYEGCSKAVDEFLCARGLRIYLHPLDRAVRVFVKP